MLLAATSCSQQHSEPDYLPDVLGEWTATGDLTEFVGDDLFVYINGGAEIYHEYGFERLAVREYQRDGDPVSVELYTMANGAYGIYSYARSASGLPIDLGAGGTLADYYLHFWSGPHLIAVTARSVSSGSQSAVLELAGQLAAGFPSTGELPRLMEALPTEMCTTGSERYVAGSLGLNSAAPRAAKLFRGFEEAAVARCRAVSGEEALLAVLRWADPAGAIRAVTEARARAASTEGIADGPVDDTGFRFDFDEDETMVGDRTGALVRLVVASGGDEPDLDGLFSIDNWEASHEREDRTQ
jgi:hypothetical protein